MNKFKEQAYIPPVEKYKKTIGKYQEKIDKTFAARRINQAVTNKKTQMIFTQTATKTKPGSGAYIILFSILFVFFLFVIFIVSIAKSNKTQIEL